MQQAFSGLDMILQGAHQTVREDRRGYKFAVAED